MTARISVNPELLRWAVDRSGLSLSDFSEPVQEWISGKSQPTARKLEDFARKAMVPLGYLFLLRPPQESIGIPDFRTFGDEKRRTFSPNLRDVVTDIQRRQVWMRDYLVDGGNEPLDFVGTLKSKTEVVQAADQIRGRLGLQSNWQLSQPTWESALTTLRRAMESIGIFVCVTNQVGLNTRRSLNHEEFRGFVLIDEYAPWVFVNSNDTKSAQMFTLAHEMVHVWLGKPGLFNLERFEVADDNNERFCNRVAAEFLIPKERFSAHWERSESLSVQERCAAIAKAFKVSPLVAGRRALELEYIRSKTFYEFYQQEMEKWAELKKTKREKPAPVFWQQQELRLGDRFGYAVAHAYSERRLLPSEAQDLTGFSRETFSKYAQEMIRGNSGVGP